MQIIKLEIDKISHNPNNANIYGDIANDKLQDLMASMSTEGQFEAITINQNFEIIGGARRYEAAKRLGWKTIDAIQTEVTEEETPIQMVNRNITRQKKASVLLKEYETLSKKYGKSQGRRTDLERPSSELIDGVLMNNTRKYISEVLNVSQGTLSDLKKIAEKNPSLITEIDAGNYSISGAAKALETLSMSSKPEIDISSLFGKHSVIHSTEYDVEGKYADEIIKTFLNLVKEAKGQHDFSLEKLLNKAVSMHENDVDKFIEQESTNIFDMFKDIQSAIRGKEFEPFLRQDGQLVPMTLDDFFAQYDIKNKIVLYKTRNSVIRYLLSTLTGKPFEYTGVIKLKNEIIDLNEYLNLGEHIFRYFELFSEIFELRFKYNNLNPSLEQRRNLIKKLSQAYQSLRPLARVRLGLTVPSFEMKMAA